MTRLQPTVWMPAPAPDAAERVCPLCRLPRMPRRRRYRLYGMEVCRKCIYGMAGRRQGAFALDCILLSIAETLVTTVVSTAAASPAAAASSTPQPIGASAGRHLPAWGLILWGAASIVLLLLFAARDGWRGRSPGKWIEGLRVVTSDALEPIGVKLSVKRNLPVIAPLIVWTMLFPLRDGALLVVAGAALGVYLLIFSQRLISGPRWGDGWAGTRVIWQRYAHRPPFVPGGRYCVECGYDLHGNVSGVCPECGASVEKQTHARVQPQN